MHQGVSIMGLEKSIGAGTVPQEGYSLTIENSGREENSFCEGHGKIIKDINKKGILETA